MLITRHSDRLDYAQYCAMRAGYWQCARDHWLLHSRDSRERALRSVHVSFARNAHHEYLRLRRQLRKTHERST